MVWVKYLIKEPLVGHYLNIKIRGLISFSILLHIYFLSFAIIVCFNLCLILSSNKIVLFAHQQLISTTRTISLRLQLVFI